MTDILLEKLLKSNFTFGFELEGCAYGDSWDEYNNGYTYDEDEDGYIDDDYEDEYNLETDYSYQASGSLARAINNQLNDMLNRGVPTKNMKYGTIDSDVSIDPSNSNDYTFEYASPVLKCTPQNFQRVINMLASLNENGFYTNDTCGFHHHLSWEGITERDMIWVYLNLCLDKDFRNFMSDVDGFSMTSERWSPSHVLEDISNAIKNGDYDKVLKELSDDKYRLFRIHPYGTIEWRGPRDFLNDGEREIIIDFYKKFNKYISKIIEYNDAKVLFGTDITREQLFQNLTDAKERDTSGGDRELEFLVRTHGYHDRPLQYKTERGALLSKRLMNALSSKPELFYNLVMEKRPALLPILKKGASYAIRRVVSSLYSSGIVNEKEFAENLFMMTWNATKDMSETKDVVGQFMSYIDYNQLLKFFDEQNSSDSDILSFIIKSSIKVDYKKLYNMIISASATSKLADDMYYVMEYAQNNDYSTEQQISLLLLGIKIWYRNSVRYVSINYRHTDKLLSEMNESEKTIWNNRIISALFNKPNLSWMGRLIIDSNNLDIKALIALCTRYDEHGSIFNEMLNSIQNKIKDYVG